MLHYNFKIKKKSKKTGLTKNLLLKILLSKLYNFVKNMKHNFFK